MSLQSVVFGSLELRNLAVYEIEGEMARCWTCGAYIEYPLFTCPACRTVKEIQRLRKEAVINLDALAEVQRRGFEEPSNTLSEGLSEMASTIEWGFEEIGWQLQQQTAVLRRVILGFG